MGKNINEKELIDLSKENVSDGIYIYDFDKEAPLDRFLMGQVYQQTFKAIGRIVSDISGRNDRSDKSNKDHDSCCKRVYNRRKVLTNYSNIIPLIGGRGTGKTSVLETIVQYLGKEGEKTRKRRNELLFGTPCSKNSPNFTVLDCIDADLLSDNESIFENVLMRMYKQFDDKARESIRSYEKGMGYHQRSLSSQFEKLLRSYSQKNKAGVTYIQELVETSAKVDIRDRFATLVKDFLKFIHGDNYPGDTYWEDTYLIIPVDDLDTNVKSAYKMMEEIHQYLMLNNIIVIVTMDLTQFSYICEKHFAGIVPTKSIIIEESKKSDLEQFWKKYVSVITQNYIDKILPSENRIHLPGIHNENRLVHLANFESEKRNRESSTDRKDDESEKERQPYGAHGCKTVKWVILYKIFRRTGIISDGLGKKKHYYEPDTIRKVVSLVDYLDQMDIVMQSPYIGGENYTGPYYLLKAEKDKWNDIEEILKANINSIYKDIVERMEYEKLQPERRDVFDDIRRQYRSRQHSEAFKRFQKEIMDVLGKSISGNVIDRLMPFPSTRILDEYSELYSEIGNLEYSYGNYQYLLNVYSNHVEKKMIHAILALQTTNMTSLYNSILLEKLRQENAEPQADADLEELFVDLRQIMGNSLSGNWFKQMLCSAIVPGRIVCNDRFFYQDADDRLKLKQFFESNIPNQDQKRSEFFSIQFKLNFNKDKKADREKLASILESIFILLPNADITVDIKDGETLSPAQDVEQEKEKIDNIEIRVERRDINPDELGFIMWYFDAGMSKQQIENSLHVSHYAQSAQAPSRSRRRKKEEATLESQIRDLLIGYCPSCREAPIPFYSQDFYYNLLKRLKENKDIHFGHLKYEFLNYYVSGLDKLKEASQNIAFYYIESENPGAGVDPNDTIRYAIPYLIILSRIESLIEREDCFYNSENYKQLLTNKNNPDPVKHPDPSNPDNTETEKPKKLIDFASNYRRCHYINNLICHKEKEKADIWGMLNLAIIGFIIRLHYLN